MKTTKEIEQLLRDASEAYYNSDSPILSDQEFDRLRDELEELDQSNSFLADVGFNPTSALSKAQHTIAMGSLKKINTRAEFDTWFKTVSKTASKLKMAVSLKLDGLSIELVYEKGKFIQAITRGDGDIGEDVTHTIKNAKGYPQTISITDRPVSVRCEALLAIADWKKHFKDKANPRNTASGLVRRTDAKGSEHISCIAFDVLFDYNGFDTEQDRIDWLNREKFKTTPSVVVDPGDVEQAVKQFESKRDSLPIEIDGAVVKLNDIGEQENLGEKDGRPYWARAWKFKAMGGHTILEGVEWAVGTQGTINPVAKVKPVAVGGTTISNVTLHNMDQIERLGVQIGDEVEVIRAGDVIPKIIRVVKEGTQRTPILDVDKDGTILMKCPACGSDVERDGPKLFCTDAANCEGSQFKRIQKWVKKRDIMYLGESNLKTLWDAIAVRTVVNLYGLTVNSMVAAGVGKGMATKILAEIEKSRTCTLADLIGSLSLDMLGRSEASNLVGHGIDSLTKWRQLTQKQIEAFPGYQATKARRISKGLSDNWKMIEWVADEMTLASPKPKVKGGKLSGKSFCFTGTMKNSRKDLEQKAEAAGGSCHSVSKGLTYLVIADIQSTSTKAAKARRLDIELISEDDFLKMV